MTKCLLFVVVVDKGSGENMGFTLLQHRNPLDRNAEIGIAIGQKWWGKGYGTEIMSWLIPYAFRGLSQHRLSLHVWRSNSRALKMYEKLGFKQEGCIRGAVWKDGKWVDTLWFGLLADEYKPS
ncbi:acyl-CoA N-acyltransferase [Stereum hirsutum FP-91666 SS1]|uniref:acyl-CoA N-acyltransferase n=1 Tax=Stereum hirsutum (strain FP-91666) TaxID=721885 RepID=UPI0004449D77|nr:acyl-CoA N-acyltransferase [Stereum hirsutum FP-91666 SS1]EIM80871.1 acyl-CoA N-acyltransferase [Stereum hirsutum FP-91666 SS1]